MVELLDVGSHAEGFIAGSLEPEGLGFVEGRQLLMQLLNHCKVNGVEVLRVIQSDLGKALIVLDHHWFGGLALQRDVLGRQGHPETLSEH